MKKILFIITMLVVIYRSSDSFGQERECTEYALPNNVAEKIQAEIQNTLKKEDALFYSYLRMSNDTVVVVLSQASRRNPSKIYKNIVRISSRCFRLKDITLPILLESDIKLSTDFVKLKGDRMDSEVLFIPKGYELIYVIDPDGLCRIVSTGRSQ